MLVITRRVGEVIRIGDDITIRLLGYAHGQARIGIDAPREVSVHRQEVYERIEAEKQQ